jgi:type II secretory pathway component PulM
VTVEDEELEQRLSRARARVRGNSAEVRRLRRRAKEGQARASSAVDRAVNASLRAQGHPVGEPPVPTHLPDWMDEPRDT